MREFPLEIKTGLAISDSGMVSDLLQEYPDFRIIFRTIPSDNNYHVAINYILARFFQNNQIKPELISWIFFISNSIEHLFATKDLVYILIKNNLLTVERVLSIARVSKSLPGIPNEHDHQKLLTGIVQFYNENDKYLAKNWFFGFCNPVVLKFFFLILVNCPGCGVEKKNLYYFLFNILNISVIDSFSKIGEIFCQFFLRERIVKY